MLKKKNTEIFTETILRITGKSGKLTDCFGTWKMTDEEEKASSANSSLMLVTRNRSHFNRVKGLKHKNW
ncbi:MAG: hypothetical protein M1387_09610 [Thaumarchaeota archaeon]|nr:hypothetical protein [Nitrososphaerota archaeon]